MRFNIIPLLLASASLVFLGSGCGDSKSRKDISEIKEALAKQNNETAALKKQLEEISAKVNQPQKTDDGKETMQTRLFDAAVLLAKNGPESVSHQAVNILGTIGGMKAEPVLLEMLESASATNRYNALFEALGKIGSRKLNDIIVKFLTEGDDQQAGAAINALQNRSMARSAKLNVDTLEKVLEKYPDNDYRNNRHYRGILLGAIFRFDQEKGINLLCKELAQTNQPYRKRDIIYMIINNNYPVGFEAIGKIVNVLGAADFSNTETFQPVLQLISKSGDCRLTDIILPLAEVAAGNLSLKSSYIEALWKLRDPKAAPALLRLCQAAEGSRRDNYASYLGNYPGIKKDENGKYVLVDDETMKILMDDRAKRIDTLNKMDKKYPSAKKAE